MTSIAVGATADGFAYDDAGRMVSRTAGGVTTALTWDVTSSLTETTGQGGHVFYAYDASGQRVVQARMADAGGAGGTATAYTPAGQLDDPNTASTSTGDVTGTRYYTFAGATVAVRTVTDAEAGRVVNLAFLFGDEQGSTSVMMPAHVDASGAVAPATLADASAATRTSYTPYGALRGADNAALDRGWLGQVEDRVDGATGTGLTYLNARYYDPATMRFISPDPLMNPGDPKTLDPYRYADNNPVVYTDATGLEPRVWDDGHVTGVGGVSFATADGKISKTKIINTRGSKASYGSSPLPDSYAPPGGGSTNLTVAAHGVVNFGGGALNALTSGVSGLYAKGWGVRLYEKTTGKTVPWIPAIPAVPIWGDYDQYKYSSWIGSGTFIAVTFAAGVGDLVMAARGTTAAAEVAASASETTGAAAEAETVFSGHGGILAGEDGVLETTVVPEGTCIAFYCAHKQGLYESIGNAIETGNPPAPVEVFGPGSEIVNYRLAPPFNPDLVILGEPVTVEEVTPLSDLLVENMGTCHWAACRKVYG